MSEWSQDFRRSVFLNALASLLIVLVAAAVQDVLPLPVPEALRRLLPLGAVCYLAAVMLALVAWWQVRRGGQEEPRGLARTVGLMWSVLNGALGLAGAILLVWGMLTRL